MKATVIGNSVIGWPQGEMKVPSNFSNTMRCEPFRMMLSPFGASDGYEDVVAEVNLWFVKNPPSARAAAAELEGHQQLGAEGRSRLSVWLRRSRL